MALLVDWDKGELRPAPRAKLPNRRETFYPVVCDMPGCPRHGEAYWLRKSDAQRRTRCKYCGQREARLASTIWSEQAVQNWLDELGVEYTREHAHITAAQTFYIDFVLPDGTALEINGWGHNLFNRAERDERLTQVWDGKVQFISTHDLRERPEWVKAQLKQIVQ